MNSKKTLLTALLAALMLTSGCGSTPSQQQTDTSSAQQETSSQVASSSEMTEVEDVVEDGMIPIAGDQVKDGTYHVTVKSSSKMFDITACELTVEGGKMTAVMHMGGTGYLYVYMGTGEQAAAASESDYIPFTEEADGTHSFTVPVDALDEGIDCAAFSKKKEKWYDRTILFRADSLPMDALADGVVTTPADLGLADGTYTADALTGPLNGVYSAVTLEWDNMAADGGEGIFRRAKLTDLLAEYGADTCNGLVLVPFKCQLDDSDLTAEDYNAEGLLNYPVLADVGSIAINAGTSADGLKAAKSAALWLYSNGAGEDALTETLGVVTPWNTAAGTTAVTAMQVQQVGTGILPGVALDTAAADALTANELTLQDSEKHTKAERTAFVDGALAALGAE